MKKILLFIRNLFKKSGVYYVGKTDVLPPPLSKEEEDYLCELSEKGDLKARNKLIEHNLRLVVFLAKKYENTKVDLEDLVSIGSIGLIKGVNTFSKDKNIKPYYLNTDLINTEEEWEKFDNSNKIFNEEWFTPTTLIVEKGNIIDYKMESMDKGTLISFLSENGI